MLLIYEKIFLHMKRSYQAFEVTGFHLFQGKGAFYRSESEYGPEDGRKSTVAPQCPIVEDEVLQLASFDGHDHGSMSPVQGGDHPFFPRAETDRP